MHIKKILLLAVSFLSLININLKAGNRYWVKGSGSWNDRSHWSLESGGNAGASIPGPEDNVFFDQHSFTEPGQLVNIDGAVFCKNFNWSNNSHVLVLKGTSSSRINIYGSLKLSALLDYQYKGDLHFHAQGKGNSIEPGTRILNNNIYFEGIGGEWNLDGHLLLDKRKSITLISGSLRTNSFYLQARSIEINEKNPTGLYLGSSIVLLEEALDITSSKSFSFKQGKAHIVSKNGKAGRQLSAAPITDVHFSVVRPKCNTSQDGSITATVIGGVAPYSYEWTGGTISGSASGNPLTNIGAGTYLLKVTDSTNPFPDVFFDDTVVVAPAPLGVNYSIKETPTCNGDCNGYIRATASGGVSPYTYTWSTIPVQNTRTAVNLCAGTYSVTVSDVNNCFNAGAATVLSQPTVVSVSMSNTNVTCNSFNNGIGTAAGSGGNGGNPWRYTWSNGATTATITALSPGTYTVTATDDSLCTGTGTITITQPTALTHVSSSTNIPCNGDASGTATITPGGGTPAYNYSWSTGTTATGASSTISNLSPGGYSVTVTDANNCITTQSYTITEPAALDPNISSTNVTCNGLNNGTATSNPLGGTAPYNYSWSPGGETTAAISGLSPGTYTVTVTDGNTCTATASVSITEPPALTATASATDVNCNGVCDGTATVVTGGGTLPHAISWSTGSALPTITNLCVGTYTVTVTDFNGCTATASATVATPAALSISVPNAMVTCSGNADATLTATVSGGTPAYDYLWSTTETTASISNLAIGTYTLTVTDPTVVQGVLPQMY